MHNKGHLFELIKSMGQGEKRYFKIYAGRHVIKGENQYMSLFKALDKMDRFDEKKLKKELKQPSFIKNLPFWKHYLYNLILRSLRSYHSGKTSVIQLQELQIDIQVLVDKGLIDQALKLIRKAKKIAGKYQLEVKLLELLTQERKLVRRFEKKRTIDLMRSLQEECHQYLKRIDDQFFWLRKYESVYLEGRFQSKNNQGKPVLTDLLALVESPVQALPKSFEASVYFHLMGARLYTRKKDYKQAILQLKALIHHFDTHRWMINEDQERYINIVNNYLNKCFLIGELEAFPVLLDKMRGLKANNFKIKSLLFQNVYYLKLIYHLSMKQYAEILDIVPVIRKGLEAYKMYITASRRLTMCYNISVAYFLNHQYTEALEWIDFVLEGSQKERSEFQSYSRLLQLIIHFELNNYELADYLIKSYLRFLRIKKLKNKPEQVVASAIRKLINSDVNDYEEIFRMLQKELKLLIRQSGELEEVLLWLEEKLGA